MKKSILILLLVTLTTQLHPAFLTKVFNKFAQIAYTQAIKNKRYIAGSAALLFTAHALKNNDRSKFKTTMRSLAKKSSHNEEIATKKLGLVGLVISNDKSVNNKVILGDRPPQVQAAVDKAFEENKRTTGHWLYDGAGYYELLGINDALMIEHLAHESSGKKDIYILDVGCAQGGWARDAVKTILENETCKKSGKHFHIFSITGSTECDELVQQKDHTTLYQLNKFKIENIDEELTKRGFDLKDKVDLIVSRWTLRHLVDPFGTLKQMYGLLTPEQGKLMANGFFFMFNDSEKVKVFPWRNENILDNTHTTALFRDYSVGRDAGQFLLVRNDQNGLEIPLEYTDKVHFIGEGYQNDSKVVTVYNKGNLIKSNFDPQYYSSSKPYKIINDATNKLYCDKEDQQCKKLYNYLVNQRLFDRKNKKPKTYSKN